MSLNAELEEIYSPLLQHTARLALLPKMVKPLKGLLLSSTISQLGSCSCSEIPLSILLPLYPPLAGHSLSLGSFLANRINNFISTDFIISLFLQFLFFFILLTLFLYHCSFQTENIECGISLFFKKADSSCHEKQ